MPLDRIPLSRALRSFGALLSFLSLLAVSGCGGGGAPGDDAGTDAPMEDGDVTPDLGDEDTGVDAGPACVPYAETCDNADQDCDGRVDEDSLVPGSTVCDCNGGVPPTSITIRYPAIVQSGVPAQLEVELEGEDGPLACNPGIVITTTDPLAHPPSQPLMRRYGRALFATALVTGPTQSITVTVGALTATQADISVVTDRQQVEPGITAILVPEASHFTTIPSTNTVLEDFALDGSVTLGDTLYFFASNGLGPKLYSYSVAGGVVQRSNTNPRGADHAWVGGFRALGGSIYFNAYTAGGCIKIFRYTPGDPMVTTPLFHTNPTACDSLPTQVATQPSDQFGAGYAGALGPVGDDTPSATRFDPVELSGRIYFVAHDGRQYELFEYDPTGTGGPTRVTDFRGMDQGAGVDNLFILGADAGKLSFVGPGGVFEHTPGGPTPTTPVSTDDPNVDAEIARGVRVGTSAYYYMRGHLLRSNLGDGFVTEVSDTTSTDEDEVADITVIDGLIYFSALDDDGDRNIYRYDPSGSTAATTPIANPCGSGCSDPAQPIGVLGTNFYFGARGANLALGFYRSPTGGGAASRAFSVSTVPVDDVSVVASVGGAIYFLAYEGYIGEVDSHKHPNFRAERSHGLFGFGRRQLYVLRAGSSTPVQVFETVEPDETVYFTQHPTAFTVVGNALYFVARGEGTYMDGTAVRHLYRHVPSEGMVTSPVDVGVHVDDGQRVVVGERLYFLGDTANDPQVATWKLFSHAAGEGIVEAEDALSDIVPSSSDNITYLTDVGGVLVFQAQDASGNEKLYRHRTGDALITAASARSNIVPGGSDQLDWTRVDVAGGDRSVVDGRLLLTSGASSGFVYDPTSNAVLTAADAVTIAGGAGSDLRVYEGEYYLVPDYTMVVDGTMYRLGGDGSGGGPVEYAQQGHPLGHTGPIEYLRISSGGGPVEYVRRCDAYGVQDRLIDGVAYMWVYIPGTEVCGYIASTPSHTEFPEYSVPFPSLGTRDTEFGNYGPAFPLWHDAERGITYVRGSIAHVRVRPRVHKTFAFEDGVLTLLSTSTVGNDRTGRPYVAGSSTYFAVDTCGGFVDFDGGSAGFSCSRLVRYTP